jgi:hypothetical protein
MTRDIRNVLRGKCRACTECESFISVSGLVLCDYCGCPPVQHEKTEEKKSGAAASALLSSEVEDEIDSDRLDGSNVSTSTKKSRFKGRVVYNKRYQDNTNESSQGSATSTTRSSTARTSTESSFPSSSRGSSRRSARGSKSSEASSSVFDTSASYEPSVFSESWSTVVSTSDSHRHGSSSVSDATSSSRASKEKPRRRGARRRRNNRRQRRVSSSDGKSMSDSVLKDRFGMLKPLRLEVLMDLPSPIPAIQLEHAWNPADTSPNVNVKDEDPYTLHRQPVAQSTDGIRSKIGYEQGMHLFEVHWPLRQRGTHAVIGVCTADAPLTSVGYSCLIGSNEHSWGWDLSRNETHHGSSILSYPQDIQDEETFYVPDRFKVMLDMDHGNVGFVVGDHYLGEAFTGLRGRKLYLTVSAVWGHCEISMRYLGCLDAKPLSLMSLCRRVIRHSIKGDIKTKEVGGMALNIESQEEDKTKANINALGLPQPLKEYLHF